MPLSSAARAFLTLFSEATGQKFRAIPFQVAQDAEQACLMDPPITEEELKLVVRYVRRELSHNKRTPLNENSLLWHNLMPDNAAKLQAYLHLAEQAVKRGELSRPKAALRGTDAATAPHNPATDEASAPPKPVNVIALPTAPAHEPGSLLAGVRQDVFKQA